ncbi:ATP-binding protein [Streptomyces sp. WELS2]|uniref:ATP-binding protein n=1 Tax=Streptomyces sp. WELS2 TaxID=2749435 RepID=UPI0015F04593|nr:ATP-binding protein [Streptomyces sp. WELS2]
MPISGTTDGQLRCVLPFSAAAVEVGLLRHTAARQLARWGMPAVADEAMVIVTELAANVVKHVGDGAAAALVLEWKSDRLRLEVHDRSPALPAAKKTECDDECGRGLHLVAGLAADWGVILTAVGKAVWCEIPLGTGMGCRRIERAVHVLETYQSAGDAPRRQGRSREASLDESAVELIADLLRWTAARGHDPDDFLDRAQMHYESETDAA